MSYNLRVITNLACNGKCYFCYQKDKRDIKLDLDFLKNNIDKYAPYERAAIYGGEATLLEDLHLYMYEIKKVSKIMSITTNGTVLTKEKLKSYADAGLDEMGISVPTMKYFDKLHDTDIKTVLENIDIAREYIPNVRINIVENKYNFPDEFIDMIKFFAQQGLGVLICRNFTEKYPDLPLYNRLEGITKIGKPVFGVQKYSYDNVTISYYEPVRSYNENDYIISPKGIYYNWLKFITSTKKIGIGITNDRVN